MARYSVTVKIVHTWYEEIVVEAHSEEEAEMMADLREIAPHGDPTVDRYAYSNGSIEELRAYSSAFGEEPPAEEAQEAAETAQGGRARTRSRRTRGRGRGAAAEEAPTPGPEPVETEAQAPVLEEPVVHALPQEAPSVEAVEVAPAEPTRTRRRTRTRPTRQAEVSEGPTGEAPVVWREPAARPAEPPYAPGEAHAQVEEAPAPVEAVAVQTPADTAVPVDIETVAQETPPQTHEAAEPAAEPEKPEKPKTRRRRSTKPAPAEPSAETAAEPTSPGED